MSSSLTSRNLIRVAQGGYKGHGWSLSKRKSHAWYAASLANVERVSTEVRDLLRRNTEKELRAEVRASHRFYDDIIKLQDCLDMTEEGDEATLEALEAARDTVLEASEEFQKLPDANRFVRTAAVAKLSAIRGLETKDQIQKYLEDVDVVVNWRLGRAEHAQTVKDEGYTDRHGVEHSPAEIASKKERDDAGRADPMARRRSAKGHGLQDTAANDASMRREQEQARALLRPHPHRQRDAVDAAHKARNAAAAAGRRAERGRLRRAILHRSSRRAKPGDLGPRRDRAARGRVSRAARRARGRPERVRYVCAHRRR